MCSLHYTDQMVCLLGRTEYDNRKEAYAVHVTVIGIWPIPPRLLPSGGLQGLPSPLYFFGLAFFSLIQLQSEPLRLASLTVSATLKRAGLICVGVKS